MNPKQSQARNAVALFLFISGFCSLAYQVVWLREFRLVFGGSTAAGSAVLGVFMGALGLGGWYLGKKLDHSKYPGKFYAWIEIIIAGFVMLSPVLLLLLKQLYYASGGIASMGVFAIILQMFIAVLVLGIPTFFMGATLPAAIRVSQDEEDENRQGTAILYGLNIAGAMIGAYTVNFHLLELLGNTLTLCSVAGLNIILGITAYKTLGRGEQPSPIVTEEKKGIAKENYFIYALAFFSGLIFFMIEILWFRTSIPLLGGSVYNFGLILVIILFGMSLGGGAYSILLKFVQPSYRLLTVISATMAVAIAVPYIWGNAFAQFSIVLHSGYINYAFFDRLWTWFVIGGFLVFPTSFIAGLQFPLFISLLGKGNAGVGTQVGRAYAFNTLGSVIGSILCGFILIPMLNIPITWAILIGLSTLMTVALIVYVAKKHHTVPSVIISSIILIVTIVAALQSSGITGYWQQNPIGFGRSYYQAKMTPTALKKIYNATQRSLVYTYDGRELSGGVSSKIDTGLLSNGKSDGSAIGDSATQIMLGMIGAVLHEGEPKNACVIGLGTGTSAGWLAEIPSIKSVNVYELEPYLIECAKYYKAVNHDVVNHPKVNIIIGDARESLIVNAEQQYDLIASEPSNPQRAGVANLYTKEFYESIHTRLKDDGVFTQWLQAYEIETSSVYLILSTLNSVFPHVEVMQSLKGDLVFVCKKSKGPWNLKRIEEKIAQEPFKKAMQYGWGAATKEIFASHFIANTTFVQAVAKTYPFINTDDQNILEFTMGKSGGTSRSKVKGGVINKIIVDALQVQLNMPEFTDKLNVDEYHAAVACTTKIMGRIPKTISENKQLNPILFQKKVEHLDARFFIPKLEKDKKFTFVPSNEYENFAWLQALSVTTDERALKTFEKLKTSRPVDYHCLRIVYFQNSKEIEKECQEILALFKTMQTSLWGYNKYLITLFSTIEKSIKKDPKKYKSIHQAGFEALKNPFACHYCQEYRLSLRLIFANQLSSDAQLEAFQAYEPYVPFSKKFLEKRMKLYEKNNSPLLQKAKEDLEWFNAN